jgi:hypothetical protein
MSGCVDFYGVLLVFIPISIPIHCCSFQSTGRTLHLEGSLNRCICCARGMPQPCYDKFNGMLCSCSAVRVMRACQHLEDGFKSRSLLPQLWHSYDLGLC